jgi:hypothetical protein
MGGRDKLFDRCVNRIQNAGCKQMAEILSEIGQQVLADSCLENQARQETIESIRTLAWEASLPSAERDLEVVNAALAYIPSLLIPSLPIYNYFQGHLQDLRKFFDAPG